MKNILNKFHISIYTYLFIFLCFISGYIKNILIIFFICIIHEFGHLIFISLFKYKIKRIEILPFGGYTRVDKLLNSSINKDLIISIGGILMQLLLFIGLYYVKSYLNTYTYNLFIYYNKILIIFNLLPIIPLDGSKIINLLLDKYLSFRLSYLSNLYISIIFLILFLMFNYIYNYDNYFIIIFLFYSIITYYKNYKYIINRFLLERYLYNNNYSKIEYHTKDIKDLKKDTYHYFDYHNTFISEKQKLRDLFDNKSNI